MTTAGLAARGARNLGLAVLLLGTGCNTGVIGLVDSETGASGSDCTDDNSASCTDSAAASEEEDSGQQICEPGARQCSSDFSNIVQCDEDGTTWVKTGTCTSRQACAAAACVEANTTLGEVTMLGPAENMQEVALAPGKYGLAVVNNVIASNARELPFPVEIEGELLATNAAMVHAEPHSLPTLLDHPLPSRLPLREGARIAPHRFAQPHYYRVGDQRVFSYLYNDAGPYKRTGELRHSGTSVNIWEDITKAEKGSLISDADLAELVRRVDTGALARVVATFGTPPDVDGNGKVDVFLTDLLAGNGGFVKPATLYPQGYYSNTDFGEVIYLSGPDPVNDIAWLAASIGHELTHLIYDGVWLQPYLNPPREPPDWYNGSAYLCEGLSVLSELLSGQNPSADVDWALYQPELWTLGHLFDTEYAADSTLSGVLYGEGGLMIAYLFEQAGGVEITSPASVTDRGGLAFLKQFIGGRPGTAQLILPDGRGVQQSYVDMAAAVLRGSLAEYLPPLSDNQPNRYAFRPVQRDPVFGNLIGVPQRHEAYYHKNKMTGPALTRPDWSQHLSTLLEGGVAFHELIVGPGGATLKNTDANTHVVLLRYADN